MKLSAITTNKQPRPFIADGKLTIDVTANEEGRIHTINVAYRGASKSITVKNDNVLAAWKELEAFKVITDEANKTTPAKKTSRLKRKNNKRSK